MSWESQMLFTDDEWIDPKIAAVLAEPRVRDVVSRTLQGLSFDAQAKVIDVIRDVALGKVALEDVSDALVERALIDDERAYDIDGELYAEIWSDVEDELAKQVTVYAELHPEDRLPEADSSADPNERIAEAVIAKSALFPMDPAMRKRLHNILLSQLKDIRDETETRTMLEKPPKTGGLGLAPTVAASVLLFLAESKPELERRKGDIARLRVEAEKARTEAGEMRKKRIVELRSSATLTVSSPVQSVVPTQAEVASFEQAGEDRTEDDADIAKIKAALVARGIDAKQTIESVAVVAAQASSAASPLDAAVDGALTALGGTFASEELKNRMKTLVSLYFRDLRDQLETTSKMTMPVVSGGMGMTDQDAVAVMRLLKERNAAFHAVSHDKVKEGKQQFVANQQARTIARDDAAMRRETDALDSVFSNVTGQKTGTAPVAPAMPRTIPVTAIGRAVEQVVVVPKPMAAAVAPPVPVALPASASVPVPTPTPMPMPIPAASSLPLPAPVQVARIQPIALPVASDKPSMADVSGVPQRLTGPVEELKALTIKDLRRLSRDPREALLKLRDKIDLLAEQSFDFKTKGIKAWQESEVNVMYLDLLRKSLEGVPVADLIAQREGRGEPTLNKAEFDAIMAFNRALRFG